MRAHAPRLLAALLLLAGGALAQTQTPRAMKAKALRGLVVKPSESSCTGGCWLPASYQDSSRVCQCVVQECSEDKPPDLCNICSRGFGVYKTRGECQAGGNPPTKKSIPPGSYPPLKLPTGGRPSRPSGGDGLSSGISTLTAVSDCPSTAADPSEERAGCPFYGDDLAWWHEPATWGADGSMPAPGSPVTLPAGVRVIVGGCSFNEASAYFESITIPEDSVLIFADQDVQLSVGTVTVKGKLLIGAPGCRLRSLVGITFKKHAGLDDADFKLQTEGPAAQLDIHGREFSPTWTRLAAKAIRGATLITLKREVDWRPGQQVVVVSTHMKDTEVNRNEVMTIQAVEGAKVTLTAALKYLHYGGAEYQAEVGLLSRNVLIQSEDDGTNVGAHLKLMGPINRLSGVMQQRMGQTNVLGRYGIHFHMVGDTSPDMNFVKDSSCYGNHFRCVAIHGTNNALVQGTVSFDTRGSHFYIEAGTESGNVFDANLAARVLPVRTDSVSGKFKDGWIVGCCQNGGRVTAEYFADPTDAAAAGFYGASIDNTWTNNAASGGFFGFSFPALPSPITDELRDVALDPSKQTFVMFDGNSAHSTGWAWDQGAAIYLGGKLWYDNGVLTYHSGRSMERNTASGGFVRLTDSKVFLTRVGVLSWGKRAEIIGLDASDTYKGAHVLGKLWLTGARINARTRNPPGAAGFPATSSNFKDQSGITAFQFYDTGTETIISDSTFVNFRKISSLDGTYWSPAVFTPMTHSDFYTPTGCMSFTSNISYVNTHRDVIFRNVPAATSSYRFFQFTDMDGTAVKRKRRGHTIVGSADSWWRWGPDGSSACELQPSWGLGTWLCHVKRKQTQVARLDWHIKGHTSTRALSCCDVFKLPEEQQLGTVSQIGFRTADTRRSAQISRHTGVMGYTGMKGQYGRASGWHFSFTNGAPRESIIYLTQVPAGTFLYASARYPKGAELEVRQVDRWKSCRDVTLRAAGSSGDMMSDAAGLKYWIRRTKKFQYLYLKVQDPLLWGGLSRDGVTVPGNRWYDFWLSVTITNADSLTIPGSSELACGQTFCALPAGDPVSPQLPRQPAMTCTDTPPAGGPQCMDFRCDAALCTTYAGSCDATCKVC